MIKLIHDIVKIIQLLRGFLGIHRLIDDTCDGIPEGIYDLAIHVCITFIRAFPVVIADCVINADGQRRKIQVRDIGQIRRKIITVLDQDVYKRQG